MPSRVEVAGPPPPPAVLAAIVAAVELVWPEPQPAVPAQPRQPEGTAWRFAGRWWSAPARRGRP